MPVIRANGIDMHYRIAGAGPETVVLVNGVGDDLEGWAMQLDPLLAAGLRVITFDNRGVGRSSCPPGPYSSREMAADTKALADAIGLSGFHLVGVSMGGVIAQEYALAYPDDLRSVVLANTYARPDAFTRAAFGAWGQVAESAGMQLMMRQQAPWVFSPVFYEAHPDRLATIVGEMEQQLPAGVRVLGADRRAAESRQRGATRSLRTPALVIAADDDIIIRLSLSHRLYEELPNGSWAIVPGGHAAFIENPDPWNRAVVAFIERHRVAVH